MADHDADDILEEEEEEVKRAPCYQHGRLSFNILTELACKRRKYGRLPLVTSKHLYKPLHISW